MYDEAVKTLNPTSGTLSVDDSVLDEPYSYSVALVGCFWSGKHHRSVKGINLITFYYTDISGLHKKWPQKIGQRDKCLLGSSRHLGSRFVVDAVRRAPVKRLVPSLGIVEGEYRPSDALAAAMLSRPSDIPPRTSRCATGAPQTHCCCGS